MRCTAQFRRAGWGGCLALIAFLAACQAPERATTAAPPWRETALGLCEDYPEETRSLEAARRDLAVARETGARVLRVAFGWDAIEAERGRYDWSFWDDFVRLAVDEHGLTLIPYVCYTPRWAASDAGADFWRSPPRDPRDFEAFMRTIATRYRGKIQSWELWNEADNAAYWLGTTAQFAALVRAGSRGVRGAAPEAKVVLGGIAGKTEFLEALFAQERIAPAVDVVNCHAYYETWHPDPTETLTDYLARCREIIDAHGEHEPLWLAEVGYSTVGTRAKVSEAYRARFRGEHTAEAQAQALTRTLVLALASGELPVVAWYRINDLPPDENVIGDDNNRHLGVRDAGGAPKPALRAFAELAALFAQPYRPLTVVIRARGRDADAVRAQAFALRDGRSVVFAWLAHPGSAPANVEPREDDRDAVAAIDLPGGRSLVLDLRGDRVEQRLIEPRWAPTPPLPTAARRGFSALFSGQKSRLVHGDMQDALRPTDVQLIGSEVAIRWSDGAESYIAAEKLRANSPSAEVKGEQDIFGNQYGGEAKKSHTGVTVTGWEQVGNYAIRFDFSDGHRTGLYSYALLRELGGS